MSPINDTPQPDRHRALGGKKIRGKHTRGGCLLTVVGLAAAGWLLDVLLAGSAVMA